MRTLDHKPTPSPDDISRAKELLTERQYAAWRLWITGAGYKRLSLILNISPEGARDRIQRAQRKLTSS